MHNLGITVIAVGLVIFTVSAGWIILHTGRRFLYHWRHAAHVIEATWEPEPIPGFIGSMMLADDGEWDGGTFAFAPAPVDWPEDEPEPAPGPGDVTVEFFEGFPQWQEPTRTQTTAPAWLDEALRAQDDDAALFMSWFRSQVAASRVELAKVLT